LPEHGSGSIVTLLPPQPVDADIAIGARRVGRAGAHRRQGRRPRFVRPAAAPDTDEAGPEDVTPGSSRSCCAHSKRGLPVLGICRGAQILNVALGRTLHQNLPDVVGHNWHQAGNAVFNTFGDQPIARHRWLR